MAVTTMRCQGFVRSVRASRGCARVLALALLLAASAGVEAEVIMVYSVQRHGARNVLPKTSLLQETDADGGPTLLPEGQRQAYNAGVGYLSRYLNATTCPTNLTCFNQGLGPEGPEYGVVGTADGEWNNHNTLFRSSALDRTIMTADSFLAGVFPAIDNVTAMRYLPSGEQVIPVYTLPEDSDPLIRGYTSCPTYNNRLLDWYTSDEFNKMSATTEAFRDGIGALDPGLNISLENWYNVYDAFNVYRAYNVGIPMPTVNDTTFTEIVDLAYWLETAKMRSNLTGNLLSGLLLGDALSYIDAAATAVSSNLSPSVYFQIVHISSHYNTQLGLLGTLKLDQYAADSNLTWFKKIPSNAAIMAFELHANTSSNGQYAVRLVLQDGPAADYITATLPCAEAGDSAEVLAGPGACTLESFQAMAAPLSINTTAEWCDACENSSLTPCQLRVAGQELLAAQAAANSSSGSSSGSGLSSGAVAGIAVGCAVAGAALAALGAVLYIRRTGRLEKDAASIAWGQEKA